MAGHVPVMLAEVLATLHPQPQGVYVDGTFGGGGYTQAILAAPGSVVIAVDKDPSAMARGRQMQKEFGARLKLYEGSFAQLNQAAREAGFAEVDGVVLDLGVSSYQIDSAERGFSFSKDGPLDMRMGGAGQTAAELVNQLSDDQLADIFRRYGEERNNKKIARAIAQRRKTAPFARTLDLANFIAEICPQRGEGIHPATRVFQALRIAVNSELDDLEQGLQAAIGCLKVGGRLVVVSFHSLEDRLVKQAMQAVAARREHVNKYKQPTSSFGPGPAFIMNPAKPLLPTPAEIKSNPRARSAKLRVLERVQ